MARAMGLATALILTATCAAASPCDDVARFARALPTTAWFKGDAALAPALAFADRRSIGGPAEPASPDAKAAAHLPAVRAALEVEPGELEAGYVERVGDLYAVSVFQGTLECQQTVFVRAGKVLSGPPGFDDDSERCWTRSASLGQAGGAPVLAVHDLIWPGAAQAAFDIWPWHDGWGKVCGLKLSFAAAYQVSERRCLDAVACAAAGDAAREMAIAYNRLRDADGKVEAFAFGAPADAAARALVAPWLAARQNDTDTPDYPSAPSRDERPFSYTGFTLIPVKFGARWYAVGVGHQGVGWREDENTLIAVYAPRGAELKPLAGFVVTRSIAGLAEASVAP